MTEQATPFDGVKLVVSDALKFKGKLAIGENAYASLRHANAVRKYWDLFGAVGGGAAVAKSGLVASALGAASTPVGWVVAAAVVSGGAWYGVMRMLNGASDSRVTVIPKFINTPIDVLATVGGGLLRGSVLSRVQANGVWRLVLDVETDGASPLELKAYLVGLGRKLTETWLYQWRGQA